MIIIGVNQLDPNSTFITDITQLATNQFQCRVCVLVNTTDQTIYEELQNSGAAVCLAKPVRRKKLHDSLVDVLISKNELTHSDKTTSKTEDIAIESQYIQPNLISVLAVDDYPSNLKLVAALLENLGVKADCANNGYEALEYISRKKYDLIFMDIQMPGIDGIEVTNRIRGDEVPGMHIPIIALTAHALAAEREAVLRAGMDDYLTKPIDEKELQRVIAQWTKKKLNNGSEYAQSDMPQDKPKIPVDWQQTLKLAANKSTLAKDMLMGLVESLKPAQTNINQTFTKKDYKNMREHVHRLHGACCYCGVPALKAAVLNVESALAKKELENINFLVVELNKEINRLQRYVQNNKELLDVTTT
jgi:two-component system sensor histidine kinase BarA